jgi:NitT/TauT family transport system substrate-binding protein
MTILVGWVRATICFALIGLAQVVGSQSSIAETIKIGLLKVTTSGPIMIAQERGYFAQEGMKADLFFTDQPPLISEGIATGELTFGITAPTAGFFNLASQGTLHIIAGNTDEAPGFKAMVVVVSNQSYATGVGTLHDLGGRSFAIIEAGSPQQYDLSVIAQKYGFDYSSDRMLILGNFPNIISAVSGGTADFAFVPFLAARRPIVDQKLHNIASISDEMRMTVQVVMTSASVANGSPDLVNRFLRVYRAGMRDYHDAFIGPDERPRDGTGAAQDYSILAKYLGTPVDLLKLGVGHNDADGRLDVADILHQIAWYKSQGMVKPEVDGSKIIDMRYVLPLSPD